MPNPDIPSVPAPELHETSGFAPDLAREVIKPESLDAMIVKLGIPLDKVDPAVKLQILAELGKLHVDGKNKPEENPAILDAVIKQLESFGFTTKQDIHRESYVIDSALDARTADINERLTRAKLPMLSYPSNTGIYAFAVQIVDGKLSYQKDMKSSVVTDPFENHFFRPFNQKADMNQTAQNVYDLGLGKYFQIVQDAPGKPVTAIREGMEDFQHGFVLEDLLRLRDAKGFEYLKQFDVAQSVVTAVKMIDDVHKRAGRGVGELGIQDVMMQVKDGKLVGARLSLPDAVYNKGVEKIDQ